MFYINTHMYVFVFLPVYVGVQHVGVVACEAQKRGEDPLELELQKGCQFK